jgi:hypothetical protein
MSKGLARSIGRAAAQRAPIVKDVFVMNAVPITSSGATGDGFGTVVIGDFPEGNILLLGAIAYAKVTKVTAAGTLDTFTGAYSVGSTPTADATLTGTDVDVIPSTALSAAVAGASAVTRGAQPAQAILDNTDGSLELNFNLKLDDASVSADGQILKIDGFVEVAYIVLGDD